MTLLSFLFIALLISSPSDRGVTAAFAPRNKTELHDAVDACIKLSPVGHCSASPHGPIGSWNVSAVTDMKLMFNSAEHFDQDLSEWDVSAVATMSGMFFSACSFNQDLSAWDVSSVSDMSGMLQNAKLFNQDLSVWDVSAVTAMNGMFFETQSFNQDLSAWDVSAVTDMCGMFGATPSFNQDLSAWNVSAVTDMSQMFYDASSFNQDLSEWNVSAVTDMSMMFYLAPRFNQDLSAWNVSNVSDMSHMFQNATSFDQILCGVSWVKSKAKKENMFTGSSGSISSTVCTTTTTTTTTSRTTIKVTAIATIGMVVIGSICVVVAVVVVALMTNCSNKSSDQMQSLQNPLITSDDTMTPNCDLPFTSPTHDSDPSTIVVEETSSTTDLPFTSPTHDTDPNTIVVEETSSTTDPAFTSPTHDTDPSTTVVEETNSTIDTTLTSTTHDIDPSTIVVEETSSNAGPASTSPTDGVNPSTRVVPLSSRTFNTSNYKRFYTVADAIGLQHHLLSAVENMLMLYAKRTNATEDQDDEMLIPVEVMSAMLQIQDDAFKHDEAMKTDIDAMTEYLWTSGKKLSVVNDMELCSVINAVIRDDVAEEIEAATIIFRCLNSRRIRRHNVLANINAQSYPPNGETWRGGSFRREHRAFFERMIGKKYRVPGFLATSLRREIAAAFAFKADMTHPSHPCAMWRITFDPKGKENPEYRVRHMTLVSKTLAAGEHEYLFAPYSVFTLVSVKWRAGLVEPHEFTIQAARDNKEEDECLPLTPWY